MEEKNGVVISSYDEETERLQILDALNLVHSDPEESFDRVSKMVCDIFDMPIVLISLVSSNQQWFKSCIGLPEDFFMDRGIERQSAFCQYVVAHKEPLIVYDAKLDERFKHNRLVARVDGIRFYAGVPLVTRKGNVLGTLCVIDSKPRQIEKSQMKLLQQFSELVITEIELRQEIDLRSKIQKSLIDSEERYKTLVELSPDMIVVLKENLVVYINPAGVQLLKAKNQDDVLGKSILSFIHPEFHEHFRNRSKDLQKNMNVIGSDEREFIALDGSVFDAGVKDIDIFYNGVHSILLIAIDVTTQKKIEKELLEANKTLLEMSTIDGLTGVFNRRQMDEFLNIEWSRSIRNITPLSLIMLDIDFFKYFNDTYGHQVGDQCLKAVAEAVRSGLSRPTDFLARYGGEEFVVILPDTSEEGAMNVAERIRQVVFNLGISNSGSKISDNVTISIGVSTLVANMFTNSQQLIDMADKALYTSKRNGRNQVNAYKSSY
jgi:diguanylate cyclase (GGDEF)-like protein/PAS domain S-box-containing protein